MSKEAGMSGGDISAGSIGNFHKSLIIFPSKINKVWLSEINMNLLTTNITMIGKPFGTEEDVLLEVMAWMTATDDRKDW